MLVKTTGGIEIVLACFCATFKLLLDKAAHLSPIDVGGCITRTVWATGILIVWIMKGFHTLVRRRVGHAHIRGDAVRTRKCAKVRIERTVLLHNHNHVLDFVNVTALTRTGGGGASAGRQGRCGKQKSQRKRKKILCASGSAVSEKFHRLPYLLWLLYSQYYKQSFSKKLTEASYLDILAG